MAKSFEYLSNGISIEPAHPSTQDSVKITYNGLLPKSGATEVFAHVSFNHQWEHTNDYNMKKTHEGFETSIKIPQHAEALNFCFRDAINNWDNNSGWNYSIDVEKKEFASRGSFTSLETADEFAADLDFKSRYEEDAAEKNYSFKVYDETDDLSETTRKSTATNIRDSYF